MFELKRYLEAAVEAKAVEEMPPAQGFPVILAAPSAGANVTAPGQGETPKGAV